MFFTIKLLIVAVFVMFVCGLPVVKNSNAGGILSGIAILIFGYIFFVMFF
ncbi:MAG: hypothetical protein M0R46_00295 [Candidatus Muirbacterium halophilum]|nr:hypothetical protein [Candidatus Muirbacterium halophilum]MCK9474332.1 hypothetical protein [Candidatus Muirbacterium halophilum]